MRAFVGRHYGPPRTALELVEQPTPSVTDDRVLVRVKAASVNPADWHIVRGEPVVARLSLGLSRPKDPIPGCDVAGVVIEVGPSVTRFVPGDEVMGSPFDSGLGAFAEYVSVPEDRLALKPPGLSFECAAAVPLAACTALQAVRDHGAVKPGQRVLIIGASGGVGGFAVQLAKHFEAEVTAVCSSANLELVRSLGADQAIDYTSQDCSDPTVVGPAFDLIVQLGGGQAAAELRRVLAPNGTLLLLSGESTGRWFGPIGRLLRALIVSPFIGQKLAMFTVVPKHDDLELLARLVEQGVVRVTIERRYSFADTPDAVTWVEQGHSRGKVVIAVEE